MPLTDHRSTLERRYVSLFGATPDTGNLGVEALFHSLLAGLRQHEPEVGIYVFDHGLGRGPTSWRSAGEQLPYDRIGMRRSRRYHRWESTWRYRLASRSPSSRHPGVVAIRRSMAGLDISGGDSFSDIYGLPRFDAIVTPKELTLALGRPLVLLPQTYGPFTSPEAARRARAVLLESSQVWARDEDSLAAVQELCPELVGDPRCRLGVDVAFALPVQKPTADVVLPVGDGPLAGINVSGLIVAPGAEERFGFRLSYLGVLVELVEQLVARGARVLLVPHVGAAGDGEESDRRACERLVAAVSDDARQRVTIAGGFETAAEAKWVVSQCDWFVGTRMHSTIAALSTEIPTAAIAYSDKTAGVFGTCQQMSEVVDARRQGTREAVEQLVGSFLGRVHTRAILEETMPDVRRRARSEVTEALDAVLRR